MFLSKYSIKRPIATTMGIVVFLIFGILAYLNLNLNQMPEVEIPIVTVQTVYPGAGPKEIETLVSNRLEDAVSTVSQIERLESYSLDGISIVIIEFELDKDIDVANQEVKDKIDQILNELPEDSEDPIVQKVNLQQFPIIDVVLSGDASAKELFNIADETLRDRFSQIAGVAKVNLTGGQEREIKIVMDNKTVFQNKISFPQMLQIIEAHNMNIPGGYFQIEDQEYTVRMKGEFDDLESMRNLRIPTAFGLKRLGQLAEVKDGGKDIRQKAVYYNNIEKFRNENVVKLGIVKSSEGNVVKVADGIRAALPDIKETLPEGLSLQIVNDRSVFTRSTVNDTMSNIILGVIFTSLVLFIFLTNIRSTFIVAITMPTSIISTFLLLQLFELSLNMMTLMGISVSVGVLVANSVVVLENIFRHKRQGKDNKQAADVGTAEVAVAVVAATMTNLVVFLPIAAMTSLVGRFLRELALATSFATLFSLIFSLTLTPMLASLMLGKSTNQSKLSQKLNNVYNSWDEKYRNILRKSLKNKKISGLIILGAFILFIAVSGYYGPKVGTEFMPQMDDGNIKIEVELPQGYNLNETAKVLKEIEDRVKQHDVVKHLITNLGKISDLDIGTNMARMDVKLVKAGEREVTLAQMISKFVKQLSDIPNARITVDYGSGTGPGGAPIQLFLQGQELAKLETLKDTLMKDFKDVPGLINLDHSSRSGKPELTVFPKRQKIADAGLTVQEIALTLRSAIAGMESSQYREMGEEYDITLTLSDKSVDSPEEVGSIPIVSQTGQSYKLSELAEVKFTTGYTKILHRDKYKAIKFSGSPAPGVPMGNVTAEMEKHLENIDLPAGYKYEWGGTVEMMDKMLADMLFAFVLAVVLTYMLLAAILESFLQPFFILLTLPLALIGVFLSLFYTGISFAITSLMAIIMLIGIVVNNAILMLDYTNQLVRNEGMNVKDALIEACPVKLRPIIMATIAIILGMLPLALGIGAAGKEMRIPLGVVSIGGLIVSTLLTLVVIPAFYYVTSKSKDTKTADE